MTEDIALVARKMSAPAMSAHDEEAADPFADVDDAFPQEGWQRQKEIKKMGSLNRFDLFVYLERLYRIEILPGAGDAGQA